MLVSQAHGVLWAGGCACTCTGLRPALPHVPPKAFVSITVIMLVFLWHNGCFQGCSGPFGLGYGWCKAWYCQSRDGFTGDKDAVTLVLAGLHAVPPYASWQSTVHILPISINFPPNV